MIAERAKQRQQHHDASAAFDIGQRAIAERVVFNVHDARCYDGTELKLKEHERPLANFGGCSYLGLDQHPSLKSAAIDATQRFGTQFSFSRAFVASPLYDELEHLLDVITDGHVLVTPTTTLGHIATIPTIVSERDVVVIDRSAHASLHLACTLIKHVCRVVVIDHDDLDAVERELESVRPFPASKVWYVLDGLYSMHGDVAPFDRINELMSRHERLHIYVDDAHATSWTGRHGRGLALDSLTDRSRVVVALSLNKAFSAAGGAIVFSTREMRLHVKAAGGPMLFSGPVQPPMLGAAIASAKLHLTPCIEHLQRELMMRIDLMISECDANGIDVAHHRTPIFFAKCGDHEAAFTAVKSLRAAGFYASPGIYPAVPRSAQGVRFTVSTMQTEASIGSFVRALAAARA